MALSLQSFQREDTFLIQRNLIETIGEYRIIIFPQVGEDA